MTDTSGFYKTDNGGLLYAPTQISSADFDLTRDLKDTYTYPANGWHWFDSEESARVFFNLPKPRPGQVLNTSEIALWRARAVLKKKGLFDTIDAYVNANINTTPELYEVWNYGNVVDRESTFIKSLGPIFGLTDAQIDTMFMEALTLEA